MQITKPHLSKRQFLLLLGLIALVLLAIVLYLLALANVPRNVEIKDYAVSYTTSYETYTYTFTNGLITLEVPKNLVVEEVGNDNIAIQGSFSKLYINSKQKGLGRESDNVTSSYSNIVINNEIFKKVRNVNNDSGEISYFVVIPYSDKAIPYSVLASYGFEDSNEDLNEIEVFDKIIKSIRLYGWKSTEFILKQWYLYPSQPNGVEYKINGIIPGDAELQQNENGMRATVANDRLNFNVSIVLEGSLGQIYENLEVVKIEGAINIHKPLFRIRHLDNETIPGKLVYRYTTTYKTYEECLQFIQTIETSRFQCDAALVGIKDGSKENSLAISCNVVEEEDVTLCDEIMKNLNFKITGELLPESYLTY